MTAAEWAAKARHQAAAAQAYLVQLDGLENEAHRIGVMQLAKDCLYNASKAIAEAIRLEWEAIPDTEEVAP
jgi:hypothetical protein